MAVDPRILAGIANPTGGKLSEIGQTLAKNRQMAIENERQAEMDDMKRKKFMQEQATVGAKAGSIYAQDAINWWNTQVENRKGEEPSDEEFRDYQLEAAQRLDPSLQQFIPERLQTKAELQQGLDKFNNHLRLFEPEYFAEKIGSDRGKHFSGQDIFKDEKGNLFMGTGVGDPNSGDVTPSMVAVNGSDIKPSGKLRLVNKLGQTSGEVVDQAAAKLTAEALAKDDANFYTEYIDETRNMESSIDELETTQGLLTDLSGQAGYNTVGFGKYLSRIPLTDATHWKELKHTIQSRIAMNKMMTLKNASATGSTGFGQLSEKELKVLMDHLGSLEQAQKPAEIKKIAEQIYDDLGKTVGGYRNQLLQNKKRFRVLHKEYYGDTRELPSLDEAQKPPLPEGVTEQDITETMRIHSMTRKQVLERINSGR